VAAKSERLSRSRDDAAASIANIEHAITRLGGDPGSALSDEEKAALHEDGGTVHELTE